MESATSSSKPQAFPILPPDAALLSPLFSFSILWGKKIFLCVRAWAHACRSSGNQKRVWDPLALSHIVRILETTWVFYMGCTGAKPQSCFSSPSFLFLRLLISYYHCYVSSSSSLSLSLGHSCATGHMWRSKVHLAWGIPHSHQGLTWRVETSCHSHPNLPSTLLCCINWPFTNLPLTNH